MFLRHYTYNQNHDAGDEGLHDSLTDITTSSLIDRKTGELEILCPESTIVVPHYPEMLDEIEHAIIVGLLTLDIREKQRAAHDSRVKTC